MGLPPIPLRRKSIKIKQNSDNEWAHYQESLLWQELDHIYIPPQGKRTQYADTTFDLTEEIERFLHPGNSEKLLLITSISGGGKSVFVQMLRKRKWQEYQTNQSLWIPVYIPLSVVKDPRDLIQEKLFSKLGIDNTCKSELQEQHILFILDGYDELPENQQKLNLYRINELHLWRHRRVIVTCRTTHLKAGYEDVFTAFQSYESMYLTSSRRTNTQNKILSEVSIIPLNLEKVREYAGKFLAYYCKQSEQNHNDCSQEHKPSELGEIEQEFTNSPAFLRLVVERLPLEVQSVKIPRNQLFEYFINSLIVGLAESIPK